MLKSPIYHSLSNSNQVLFVSGKPFILSNVEALSPIRHRLKPNTPLLRFASPSVIKAFIPMEKSLSVKAVVTVDRPVDEFLPNLFKKRLDHITDVWGAKTLVLEFLSTELDPSKLNYPLIISLY